MVWLGYIVGGIGLATAGYSYWHSIAFKKKAATREEEIRRSIYELAILKELGDRIGYSLNVQKIIDIITGSLHQLIEYSVVSYMLLEPEKIIFKADLEKSVSRQFIDEVRDRMLKSLSALLSKEYTQKQVEETLTGAILVGEVDAEVKSFFNIPLVIGEKVVGVLTVAHTEKGLYKEEEMDILYKITNQASLAVTRLQEVVQTEQRKLNAMVESMAEGVVMTDTDFRIVVVNPVAKRALGLGDKKEVTIFDFIDHLEGKFDIRGKLEESVKLDRILTSEDLFINGRYFQILVSPVKSSYGMTKGDILGGVVIFRDITHEKEVERLREDFTSMIVHDLRSPLVGIQKTIEYLQGTKKRVSKAKQQKYNNMMHHSTSEMLSLINDMLDVAKLEAGKFELSQAPAEMRDVITSRLELFDASAQEIGLTLHQVIDKKVPEQFNFDKIRITQVINNLLSNALKYTEPGGTITIHAFHHAAGGDVYEEVETLGIEWWLNKDDKALAQLPESVLVAVTHPGVGITKADQATLFTKFRQLSKELKPVNQSQKGTGLGLAVVKGIVEAHGGRVGVGSREGEGTTFYFTLPIKKT